MSRDDMQRMRMCTGKRKHLTRESAEIACNRMDKRTRSMPEWIKLNVYRCEFCHLFHVGRTACR